MLEQRTKFAHFACVTFAQYCNTFEFNGEYYKQTGEVAMGSRLGPNYACLFVGYVEERMLSSYTGIKLDLYKRYMDDVAGTASCCEEDL